MSKKLTFIKLGGSVITHKEVPMMVREDVLSRLIKEIAQARQELGRDHIFIIGHGQGSFAHSPALRYKTMDGFVSKDSLIGMAITQDSAAQLNRIVVRECLSAELPAVSLLMSNMAIAEKRQAKTINLDVLLEYLDKGLVPVTGGDVIVDSVQGCTIWSTETVFDNLVAALNRDETAKQKYSIERVIHVSEVAGVLDKNQQTVPSISRQNQDEVKTFINGTKGFDVTGGMWHKIEECLKLADIGVGSCILSGMESGNLHGCLVEKGCNGTIIA